jgi:hypothetical protein
MPQFKMFVLVSASSFVQDNCRVLASLFTAPAVDTEIGLYLRLTTFFNGYGPTGADNDTGCTTGTFVFGNFGSQPDDPDPSCSIMLVTSGLEIASGIMGSRNDEFVDAIT